MFIWGAGWSWAKYDLGWAVYPDPYGPLPVQPEFMPEKYKNLDIPLSTAMNRESSVCSGPDDSRLLPADIAQCGRRIVLVPSHARCETGERHAKGGVFVSSMLIFSPNRLGAGCPLTTSTRGL